MSRLAVRVLFTISSAALPSFSFAVTHTWSGGSSFGPDSMSLAANWSGGTPVSGSSNLTLIFPGSATSNSPNQNIANPLSVQAMNFTGSFFQFSGNGFAMNNLGANPSISVSSAAAFFNVPVAFNAPTTIVNSATLSFDGLLSGSGPITTSGTQQINFGGTGNNTYNGTFTTTSNVILLSRNGTALAGNVVANGGFYFMTMPNQFSATSDFTANGGGMSLSNGQNQVVRDITLSNNASISFTGGNTLTVNGNIANTGGLASIGNNSFDFLDFNAASRLINVAVAGSSNALAINGSIVNGTFQKTGPGTLSLFGTNHSYTGTNIVSAGILRTQVASIGTSLLNNSVVSFAGGGTLASNVITGSGSVVLESGVAINLSAAQSYTGNTDLQSGAVINASGVGTLTGDYTSTSGINGGVLVVTENSNATLAATFSGGLQFRKAGTGVVTIGGVNTHIGSNVLEDGGLILTSDTALGSGELVVGFSQPATLAAVGSRTFANPTTFLNSTISYVGSGDFNFTNTSAKTLGGTLNHTSTGSTTIAGKFFLGSSGKINVSAGNLTLGDPGVVSGFAAAGPITVSGGTLTLKSFNFISLPDVTLAGGTLNAPNGYAIPLGAALQGNGGVTGRVASANGSTIIATGNLVIGDSTHPAGVNLDGELYTGANTVTLQDSNQAVLGSYTRVGTASSNGTLVASKGVVVNFGRNVEGRGQVQSINSLANAIIMNGDATGDSLVNYLEFTGYVKGVGTFNNVAFSGTFSPGLSPALLTVGNVVLTNSNVLDMEIGGLLRGGQYDAFDINGTMVLAGQLKLSLINSFSPSLGDQFNLFDGTTVGAFSSFNFAPLSAGLSWDTSLLYTQGIVQVVAVPEPATLGGIVALASAARRRRR